MSAPVHLPSVSVARAWLAVSRAKPTQPVRSFSKKALTCHRASFPDRKRGPKHLLTLKPEVTALIDYSEASHEVEQATTCPGPIIRSCRAPGAIIRSAAISRLLTWKHAFR